MYYVIGDIHGRFDPLLKMVKQIKDNARNLNEDHTIVFLGDYIDRGGEEALVIDYLDNEPLNGFQHIFLKGNHEEMAIEAIKFKNKDYNEIWLYNGGNTTVRSYQKQGKSINTILDFIDIKPLGKTKTHHRVGKFYLVHAGINPYRLLKNQIDKDRLWIREDFLLWNNPFEDDIVVVHGHTPIKLDPKYTGQHYPIITQNRINLDTGCVWTGMLACAVIDNKGQNLVDIIVTE